MSETKFTASNDIRIERDRFGRVKVFSEDISAENVLTDYDYLDGDDVEALSEFFQHERDDALSRWRWPEDPNFVVYPAEGQVIVLDETSGATVTRFRGEAESLREMRARQGREIMPATKAAEAYFAAHPEPKPWHEAKPGEVWAVLLCSRGEEVACRVTESGPDFEPVERDGTWATIARGSQRIESARRIWPEVPDA